MNELPFISLPIYIIATATSSSPPPPSTTPPPTVENRPKPPPSPLSIPTGNLCLWLLCDASRVDGGKTCTLELSIQLPGEVVYTWYGLRVNEDIAFVYLCWVSTLLSMVCVKYFAYVGRIVADFLHVPSNGYSSRPNDMKQYRSSSLWYGWLLLLLLHFSSTVLHLLLFLGSYIIVPKSTQDTNTGLGGS
ncbi:hypothetical protein Tco_1315348 [Tanacetum coccineum]